MVWLRPGPKIPAETPADQRGMEDIQSRGTHGAKRVRGPAHHSFQSAARDSPPTPGLLSAVPHTGCQGIGVAVHVALVCATVCLRLCVLPRNRSAANSGLGRVRISLETQKGHWVQFETASNCQLVWHLFACMRGFERVDLGLVNIIIFVFSM